ncbi:hypothetical protein AA0481_1632 [Acetobacter orientalis NRIC 0481]|nr:hypothetical protein AA0481_1632 [Acetobacter orientalis NRIC 0481]
MARHKHGLHVKGRLRARGRRETAAYVWHTLTPTAYRKCSRSRHAATGARLFKPYIEPAPTA